MCSHIRAAPFPFKWDMISNPTTLSWKRRNYLIELLVQFLIILSTAQRFDCRNITFARYFIQCIDNHNVIANVDSSSIIFQIKIPPCYAAVDEADSNGNIWYFCLSQSVESQDNGKQNLKTISLREILEREKPVPLLQDCLQGRLKSAFQRRRWLDYFYFQLSVSGHLVKSGRKAI